MPDEPNVQDATKKEPTSQGPASRERWPAFAKSLPRWSLKSTKNYQLIKQEELDEILSQVDDPEVVTSIRSDMAELELELLKLFREKDAEASREQNRHRLNGG